MTDRILHAIYGAPARIDDRAHDIAGHMPDTLYWLGYVLGLVVQFAAGFAIGRAIRVVLAILIATIF